MGLQEQSEDQARVCFRIKRFLSLEAIKALIRFDLV